MSIQVVVVAMLAGALIAQVDEATAGHAASSGTYFARKYDRIRFS